MEEPGVEDDNGRVMDCSRTGKEELNTYTVNRNRIHGFEQATKV
jgi:hypothetical protein